MRLRFTITSCLLGALVGCASKPPPIVVHLDAPAPATEEVLEPSPALALAFDPQITLDQPPLMLSREGRERSAFIGFEDQTVSTFYIRIDDRQLSIGSGSDGNNFDRYERRAIIEKSGALYR